MPGRNALQNLMDGNARFVAGTPASRPTIETISRLAAVQRPFATVLGCADSRVPVETIFDHDPGEIFVVRLAGNFLSEAALGSIEYAIAVLESPLVMVLGHTSCGAVKAAIDFSETGKELPGRMQVLSDAVAPAVRAVAGASDLWHAAVVENVRLTVGALENSVPVIRPAIDAGKVQIAGGVYDLRNGAVTLV